MTRDDYIESPLHQHVLATLKADVAAHAKRSKAAKRAAKTRKASAQ